MYRETICMLCFGLVMFGIALCVVFGGHVLSDYWSGSAKASIIEKQTGVKYTWREAAQFNIIYDAQNQNVCVVFERCEEE